MGQRRLVNFSGPGQTIGALMAVALVSLTVWQVKAALLDSDATLRTSTATVAGTGIIAPPPLPSTDFTSYVCGNGLCESALGETNSLCRADCPLANVVAAFCGDSICQTTETATSCAADCALRTATATTPTCGNRVCETALGESYRTCAEDCPAPVLAAYCGDGTCNNGETSATCTSDCRATITPVVTAICGDRTCQTTESTTSCPADCGESAVCGDAVCSFDKNETAASCPSDCSSGSNVAFICGDARCDSARGESSTNCPADCRCGNGRCDSSVGETSDSCLVDCPRTATVTACNGNGICDQASGETVALCPNECSATTSVCGNGTCETALGESSANCAKDCVVAAARAVCGDTRCDSASGETSATCPADCRVATKTTLCGNTICETGETNTTCPEDCRATVTPTGFICGDQLCQRDRGESDLNCLRDCPVTAPTPTATCTDSDGGKAPKTKGSVKFGSAIYNDSCADERQVREGFCENNRYASVAISCETGLTCQLGACLPAPVKATPSAPIASPTPVVPPVRSPSPLVASSPVAPESDRVAVPNGDVITLPDECVKAGITNLEDCRARLAALKAIPPVQPATLAAVPTARCGDGRCEASEKETCDADCRPTSTVGLPAVCTVQGLLNATSCQNFLATTIRAERPTSVPQPTVTLTRDTSGKALSDNCFRLGYSTEASCTSATAAKPISATPATTADTVRSEIPEACAVRGISKPTECAELIRSLVLPDACSKAGLKDMTSCQAFLAVQRRPSVCATSGQLTDAACLPVAETAYLPPLCKQLGQTDADQCRDAVFAKYGLPKACNGMTKESCWRLVQTGKLNDRDFTTAASKDLVTETCLSEGAVTLGSCGKKAAASTLPEDCLMAGRYTASDCDRFLFEKGRQTVASDTLSGVCEAAKITDPAACSTYLTTSRLPVECVKMGLTETETCHRFLATLDLPAICREAGVTSRDECEAMLLKSAEEKSCAGLLTNAKIDGAARSEVCGELIYRDSAAKVVCEGLNAAECETSVKTRHLGTVAEAAGRLGNLDGLENDARRGLVQLKAWKERNAATALPPSTVVGSDEKLTVLPSRAAIVIADSGAVDTAAGVLTMLDTDGDGLSDDVEKRLGTDANKAATDGQTPDREAARRRFDLTGIDRALADGQPLGQPRAEGLADDRLQVVAVSNAAKAADGSAPVLLSGTGVPGEIITIYLYSDLPLVATTTVDQNGQWQLSIDDQLGDGVHEAYVAVNHDTGRVTRKSEPLAFIIQAAQALTPAAAAAQAEAATASDVNVAATSAPTQDLGLFIIGGIMLLLAAALTVAVIIFAKKR